MFEKLEKLEKRFIELETLIQDPEIIKNSSVYSEYLKEHGRLSRLVSLYREIKKVKEEKEGAQELIENEEEKELRDLAREEIAELEEQEEKLTKDIQDVIATSDESDDRNAIVEIRAGTGGEEAALWATNLFDMYFKLAERRRWKIEILECDKTELGGYKEIIFGIKGKQVYKYIKYESGGHRVQRIPSTESSGRIHTSASTVVVLPEATDIEININPKDLKIDTLRASGPGGQNVNKTSSAVRITHIPTGIIVNCQDTPEQYKNKMKAMRILRTRLFQKYQEEQHAERNKMRKNQQGTGDRSDRIRTYNFPQNRVTDHRINHSIYNLEAVLSGDLDEFIEKLQIYDKEQKLKEFSDS